ncbi:MAG TPA: rod shape-determining protein MreC [Terriglobales bacterium]
MESVLGRYRNLIVLVGVLFAQVLGLAIQVKRTTPSEPTRLIRIWAVGAVAPLEKALVWTQSSTSNIWHNYFYLRGVRAENRALKAQIERMSLERVRISQDADQARRLQALLGFKEQFISLTLAAQVIGGSGSELSRSVFIDKGSRDGVKPDMAVITADGIVGKVLHVYHATSEVLLINDQSSGVGAILDQTRLQGILNGTPAGELVLGRVMSDETVPAGEMVLTSGGDGIFPKGLPIGKVSKVTPGSDLFLNIHVRPAADLSRLEEVLVVTKIDERQAEPAQTGAARAIDILAARLPGVPSKPENTEKAASAATATAPGSVGAKTPAATGAPKTTHAATPDADAQSKPKATPHDNGNGAPAARSVPNPESPAGDSSGPPSAKKATASSLSPKPVKATVDPKPQPDSPDTPH